MRIHPARMMLLTGSKQIEEEIVETGKRTAIDLGNIWATPRAGKTNRRNIEAHTGKPSTTQSEVQTCHIGFRTWA